MLVLATIFYSSGIDLTWIRVSRCDAMSEIQLISCKLLVWSVSLVDLVKRNTQRWEVLSWRSVVQVLDPARRSKSCASQHGNERELHLDSSKTSRRTSYQTRNILRGLRHLMKAAGWVDSFLSQLDRPSQVRTKLSQSPGCRQWHRVQAREEVDAVQ